MFCGIATPLHSTGDAIMPTLREKMKRATRCRYTNCCGRQPPARNLLFRQQFSTWACDWSNPVV